MLYVFTPRCFTLHYNGSLFTVLLLYFAELYKIAFSYTVIAFLNIACQVLVSVRGQLSRSTGARIEMNRIIEEESAFLAMSGGRKRTSY